MLHDVFICHASEDKEDFVRSLAEALRSNNVEVWYDEFTLNVGDSIREAIDRGLALSRFGIVVISPSFFEKRWTKRELNGLVAREMAEDRRLILPIWHNVDHADVLEFSPPLADIRAVSSSSDMEIVVNELLKRISPDYSPLIVAREFLIEKGFSPPVITDEWWLNIVEVKESQLLFPDLNIGWRWIFPLPYQSGDRGRERGLNIAWTALQMDWAVDAEERKICQLTHPNEVQSFLQEWPGLWECAYQNPSTLALYSPQLTIPGFDDGFADVFDELNSPEKTEVCDAFRYGSPDTTDGQKPLCGDFIAWRHPTFGNYTASELSYEFVNAHDTSYSRKLFSGFECLIWLLSSASDWMPEALRNILKQGFKDRVGWWVTDLSGPGDTFGKYLWRKQRSRFAYTKKLKAEIFEECNQAVENLGLNVNLNQVVKEFIEYGFLEGYYEEEERIRNIRRARK